MYTEYRLKDIVNLTPSMTKNKTYAYIHTDTYVYKFSERIKRKLKLFTILAFVPTLKQNIQ